jgi:DNA ligase-1
MREDLTALWTLTQTLAGTSSKTAKTDLVADALKHRPTLADYLRAVYDDRRRFHLTPAGAAKVEGTDPGRNATVLSLLHDMEGRVLTGHDAAREWMGLMAKLSKEQRDVAMKVLGKDLKCRTGVKIVNEALQLAGLDPIEEFPCALGELYEGDELFPTYDDPYWFASRKLDGIRCIAFVGPGEDPEFVSRQGIHFETLDVLAAVLSAVKWHSRFAIDGELALYQDGRDDDDFAGLMKQIRRKGHTIPNPIYYAFDIIPREDFDRGFSPILFEKRIDKVNALAKRISMPHRFTGITQRYVGPADVPQLVDEYYNEARDKGWEGIILRKNAPYYGKRTRDIYKVKPFKDAEYEVVSIDVGTMQVVRGHREETIDCMTAAVIMHKGNEVRVGSGWTVSERQRFYAEPETLIGRKLTVQYAHESTNADGRPSLRFPTVKAIHDRIRLT